MFSGVICEKCNEKMPKKANYCMNCGSPVGDNLARIKAKELEEQEMRKKQELEEQKKKDLLVQKMNRMGNVLMKAQMDSDMADQNQGAGPGGGEQFFEKMGFKKNPMHTEKEPFDFLKDRPMGESANRPAAKKRPELTEEQRAANEARMMRQMEMMNQRRQMQQSQRDSMMSNE